MSKPNDVIVNRVAQSGIVSLNLENFYPTNEIVIFDLKNFLFMELILKEKDFRKALKELDWTSYQNKHVAVTCSADAIVPIWAYMLVATKLTPYTNSFVFGDKKDMILNLFQKALTTINVEEFRDKRVVVKGCSDKEVPTYAYVEISRLLMPVVKSLMYGEPCSTVPIYKKQ